MKKSQSPAHATTSRTAVCCKDYAHSGAPITQAAYNAGCKCGLYPKTSIKNKKLVPDKNHKFIIFNLPALVTCPYSTELCRKSCYAIKAERAYPNTKRARYYNYDYTKDLNNFIVGMCITIDMYMNKKSYKNAERVYFRIHESGDIYSRDYLNAWFTIINYAKKYSNLYFNLYTKSMVYFTEPAEYYRRMYSNLIINISLWADSPAYTVERAHREKWDIYTAAEAADMPAALAAPGCTKCRCANCASCALCLIPHKKPITKICEIH